MHMEWSVFYCLENFCAVAMICEWNEYNNKILTHPQICGMDMCIWVEIK